MPPSPESYRAIPSTQDQAYRQGTHEAGLNGNNFPGEWIPTEARTKASYFLLGCAILLPWSALVNGTSFFLSRLTGSPFYPLFGSYLSSVYALTKLVCQFYCTITSKQSSPSRRIFMSIIAMILSVASLWLSTFMRGAPLTFFIFVLCNGAFLAVSAAYLSTATFAVASILGPSTLQTTLSGQGASAVASSGVQLASSVISLWGVSPKPLLIKVMRAGERHDRVEETSARMFLGVCAIYLSITLAAFAWLTRQPSYKLATRSLEQRHVIKDADERTRLITDDFGDPQTDTESHVYQVLRHNLIFLFSIAYAVTVTVAVFPAVTIWVQPIDSSIHPLLFTAVHIFVASVGEFTGRYTCSFPRLRVWSAKTILTIALSRTLFIPLILLCNIHRPGTTNPASPIINSDVLFMLTILAMGYTNGYMISSSTLAVSSLEHNHRLKGRREDVDIAATLAGSFLVLGLASGALCSFCIQAMI